MTQDERHQNAIRAGEEAWERASTGNWDESAWKVMGTALLIIREEVLYDLRSNNPRGAAYNGAFGKRLDGTAFKTMHKVTRSNLLFCMEPENRVILDGILSRWTPDERARRTHPTTLAQAIRAKLKEDRGEAADAAANKTSPYAAMKEQLTEVQA